jgi:hypothetical protein
MSRALDFGDDHIHSLMALEHRMLARECSREYNKPHRQREHAT